MKGEEQTLFGDMSAFEVEPKGRKAPESEAEKRLAEVLEMEDRDFRNLRNKLNRGQALTASEAKRLEGYREKYEAAAGVDRPEHVVVSKAAVGAHFGKTKRTIINWSHRGMPERADGYDLAAIGQWALKEGLIQDQGLVPGGVTAEGAEPGGNGGQPSSDRAYYEMEIKRLDSELKDHKLQVARGEFVRRDEVAAEWAGRLNEVAKGLDYLATRLPPLLEGKSQGEMRLIIGNETWEIRDRFARKGRFCPEMGAEVGSQRKDEGEGRKKRDADY